MHIKVIAPVLPPEVPPDSVVEELAADLPEPDEVTVDYIDDGPASVEGEYDKVLAAPDTVRIAVEAEADGFECCVIDCMADPGLEAAREAVEIPVLGTAETSMHVASMLGRRYAILTVLDNVRPSFEELGRAYGVGDTCVSIRSIDTNVLELERRREQTLDRLVHEGTQAIDHDGADTILFGCTGLIGYADAIQSRIESESGYAVPVIDPLPATVQIGRGLAAVGLSHSPVGYLRPDEKSRTFDPLFDAE